MKKEYLGTMEEDLEIWRYQNYIGNPALAKQDAETLQSPSATGPSSSTRKRNDV